jgi:TnpA family transposase
MFVRTLQSGSRTSTITADRAKVGRIANSLSVLSYVDNAAHRRKILVQLNRHEKRHELSRQIFHGLRG